MTSPEGVRLVKSNAIILTAVLLALGGLIGCSEEMVIDFIEPLGRNHLPVISPQADTSAVVGDTLRIEFSATDQDGDSLHFTQNILCTWGEVKEGRAPISHIDSRTGSFWFYPRTYDIPLRLVTVTVYDGRGGSVSVEFRVWVSAGP